MFFAYVLKSEAHDFYYKGHYKDLEKRLIQHNSGMTKSLRPHIPLKIIYFEEFDSRIEAQNRERHFTLAAGRGYLKTRISR